MNIFLSWSGTSSRSLALVLHDWLGSVIQAARPWMSDRDIGPGERWNEEISKRLRETDFGLLFLTPSNLSSPWLLFEAGALAKAVDTARVVPILLGVKKADLKFPLAQFQAVSADREGLFTVASGINKALGEKSLSITTLNSVFSAMWPELERQIGVIPPDHISNELSLRADREILEEINNTIRDMYRTVTANSIDAALSTSISQDADGSWEEHYIRGLNVANARSGSKGNTSALLEYNAAIALVPQSVPRNTVARLYSYRGAMLKRLGRLEEAESDIILALKLATGMHEINDADWNMACIQAMTGRAEDSLVRLRGLVSREPKWLKTIRSAPYFRDLHGLPEFQALVGMS